MSLGLKFAGHLCVSGPVWFWGPHGKVRAGWAVVAGIFRAIGELLGDECSRRNNVRYPSLQFKMTEGPTQQVGSEG